MNIKNFIWPFLIKDSISVVLKSKQKVDFTSSLLQVPNFDMVSENVGHLEYFQPRLAYQNTLIPKNWRKPAVIILLIYFQYSSTIFIITISFYIEL